MTKTEEVVELYRCEPIYWKGKVNSAGRIIIGYGLLLVMFSSTTIVIEQMLNK